MPTPYPVIDFHQYGSSSDHDRLLLFAAQAKDIWSWAGIPRQGWRVRMLYQRWITDSRKKEVTAFWDEASTPKKGQARNYLLGPTALTIAMMDPPTLNEAGELTIEYARPFKPSDSQEQKLSCVAEIVLTRMRPRLTEGELEVLQKVEDDPAQHLPDFANNYVLESLCQISQMALDAESFLDSEAGITSDDIDALITSLEALARPALVVDGQHRLYGAAHSSSEISLPVVAIPDCPWMEQIYQFVVINEKAQRVPGPLLTDIFGSSLTPTEQLVIRGQLDRSGVGVEERIAAVIAAREESSPFYDLVKITLPGTPPSGVDPFIPEATIRQLIEGGRGGRGWRSDDEFYDLYVKPTFPSRPDWDSWTGGGWRDYWFAFWSIVRDHYNAESTEELWGASGQTNLTKAVTLRLFQRLFMETACERMRGVHNARDTLVSVLGEDEAEARLAEQVGEKAIPYTTEEFKSQVQAWFLDSGVPVRVFEKDWKTSLDDASGQEALYDELEKAYRKSQTGELYHARNVEVFAVGT